MKTKLMIFAICLALVPAFTQSPANVKLDFHDQAEQLLEDAVSGNECIGIAAGFSVNGETGWQNGKGYSDLDLKTPFTANTLTRTASIAKPVTAVAVLQLYEQGMIDLDIAIQEYLPDFPRKKEGDITTRQLLHHSSGIGAYESNKERNNKVDYPNFEAAVKLFQDRNLLATPGEEFNYTTYGYMVLGLIIEKVSGMSYEEYIQQYIFDKLGMKHSGVEYFGVVYENKASIYHRSSKGKIKAPKPTNLSDRVAGGGIYFTVPDLLAFGNAILNNTLIKEETLEMMITDSGLKKEGNPYGMGWYLYGKNEQYGDVYGHTGAQIGSSSVLLLLPEQETVIVVVSNTSGTLQRVFGTAIDLFDLADQFSKSEIGEETK